MMNLKKKMAQKVTTFAMNAAHKAAGQVSTAGTYQPKEPAPLKQMKKKDIFIFIIQTRKRVRNMNR